MALQRDPRLRALSSDHHQALVHARQALRVSSSHDAAACAEEWPRMLQWFAVETAPHFAIEEEFLLPALEAVGEPELAARTRREHAVLRSLIGDVAQPLEERMAQFGTMLRNHVRFEERELFPVIQEKVSDEVLDAVAHACRRMHAQPAPDDAG